MLVALWLMFACTNKSTDDTSSADVSEPTDADGDGVAAADGDCDDADPSAYPGADEICDAKDQDCDGNVDEDALDVATWYRDGDGDTYGDNTATYAACSQPNGYVAESGDCNDDDDAYHPGATEACDDPNDYNCDGKTTFADADADGSPACLDCDDGNASAYPGAGERCDGVDQDCDGTVDEEPIEFAWYADVDGDGYGDPSTGTIACAQPKGTVADATDCDDTSPTCTWARPAPATTAPTAPTSSPATPRRPPAPTRSPPKGTRRSP